MAKNFTDLLLLRSSIKEMHDKLKAMHDDANKADENTIPYIKYVLQMKDIKKACDIVESEKDNGYYDPSTLLGELNPFCDKVNNNKPAIEEFKKELNDVLSYFTTVSLMLDPDEIRKFLAKDFEKIESLPEDNQYKKDIKAKGKDPEKFFKDFKFSITNGILSNIKSFDPDNYKESWQSYLFGNVCGLDKNLFDTTENYNASIKLKNELKDNLMKCSNLDSEDETGAYGCIIIYLTNVINLLAKKEEKPILEEKPIRINTPDDDFDLYDTSLFLNSYNKVNHFKKLIAVVLKNNTKGLTSITNTFKNSSKVDISEFCNNDKLITTTYKKKIKEVKNINQSVVKEKNISFEKEDSILAFSTLISKLYQPINDYLKDSRKQKTLIARIFSKSNGPLKDLSSYFKKMNTITTKFENYLEKETKPHKYFSEKYSTKVNKLIKTLKSFLRKIARKIDSALDSVESYYKKLEYKSKRTNGHLPLLLDPVIKHFFLSISYTITHVIK